VKISKRTYIFRVVASRFVLAFVVRIINVTLSPLYPAAHSKTTASSNEAGHTFLTLACTNRDAAPGPIQVLSHSSPGLRSLSSFQLPEGRPHTGYSGYQHHCHQHFRSLLHSNVINQPGISTATTQETHVTVPRMRPSDLLVGVVAAENERPPTGPCHDKYKMRYMNFPAQRTLIFPPHALSQA